MSRTILAAVGVIMAVSVARPVSGQIVVVSETMSGEVNFLDPAATVVRTVAGLDGARTVAGDGTGTAWVLSPWTGAIHRVDRVDGVVVSVYLSGYPTDLALCADGGAVVTLQSLTSPSAELVRLDASGTTLWQRSISTGPVAVAIGVDGSIWTAHAPSLGIPASIRRFDPNGLPLSAHPAGGVPGWLAVDRCGWLWVLSSDGTELRRLTHGGDFVGVTFLEVGGTSLACDHRGVVAVANPSQMQLTIYDSSYGVTYSVPASGAPENVGFDGLRRAWVTAFLTGSVELRGTNFAPFTSAALGSAAYSPGDITGLAFAASAGCRLDADHDGFDNGEEIDGGSNPFDAGSRPMSAELVPLVNGLCRLDLVSSGTPDCPYWIGVSTGPTSRGAGALGSSLLPGVLLDMSLASGGLFDSMMGYFDAAGASARWLAMPVSIPDPITLWTAFIALPEFPSIADIVPSPAFPIALP